MNLLSLFFKKCFEIICRYLPLQDKIVFDNFGGRGFGDNPKYIAQELLRRKTKAKLYWIVDNPNTPMPEGIKKINLKSFAYIYHVMTAKVYVDNIKHSHHLQKHEGQYYIQTWHGSIPLKKIEQDAYGLGQYYIINSVRHSIDIDLMYTNNDFMKEKMEKCFWYRGQVIKCDEPRISVILNPPSNLREKVCKYFNTDERKKIVLYAPTFRTNSTLDPYIWNYNRIFDPLKRMLGADITLLLRLHPNIADQASSITYNDNVMNASSYPDMQELLATADVLITDISSTMFEFGITHKPVFLICKDLSNYMASERDFYFSIDELPFKMARDEAELVNSINSFTTNGYVNKLDSFYKKIGLEESGNGDKKIADIIEQRIANA